ncbi:MAG TPA: NifU family protein [bacterium]|jgi:Fe-S cluster biogenesis protein NfuA
MSINPINLPGADAITDTDRTMAENVSKMLASLQPIFQREGGTVRLISVRGGVAHVEFSSESCDGCGGGMAGMEGGLRLMLIERVPGLSEVVFE